MPDILIGPIITDCKASSDRCTNCKRFDPQKNFCKLRQAVIETPASTTCKHWRDMADDELTCSLNPDPHGSCWTCPIDCQRWRDMVQDLLSSGSKSQGSDKVTMKAVEDKLAKERQARLQALALDRGVQQGHTLEALDTVFDIACQQVPSCKERWMILKEHIQGMLLNKWIKENEDCFRAEY